MIQYPAVKFPFTPHDFYIYLTGTNLCEQLQKLLKKNITILKKEKTLFKKEKNLTCGSCRGTRRLSGQDGILLQRCITEYNILAFNSLHVTELHEPRAADWRHAVRVINYVSAT